MAGEGESSKGKGGEKVSKGKMAKKAPEEKNTDFIFSRGQVIAIAVVAVSRSPSPPTGSTAGDATKTPPPTHTFPSTPARSPGYPTTQHAHGTAPLSCVQVALQHAVVPMLKACSSLTESSLPKVLLFGARVFFEEKRGKTATEDVLDGQNLYRCPLHCPVSPKHPLACD
eukprot:1144183-Rhodomonas_salina.1